MFQETRMADMSTLWNYAEHQEMEQKLVWTTLELEKLKSEVMEEMRRSKEYVRQLIHLLKAAIQERDDYRSQLHLLRRLPDGKNSPVRAASNLTESSDGYIASGLLDVTSSPAVDQGSLVLDQLARGRDLPAKGCLVQAVLDAGPLLQTMLLAGPLPRWRNPPQVQPFQIPPVTMMGEAFGQKMNVGSYYSNGVMMFGNNNNGCEHVMKRARFC